MARRPPPEPASSSRVDRVLAAFAAAVCLLFLCSLRDVRFSAWSPPPAPVTAAPAPLGDATLDVHVVDEEGRPHSDAVVRVFYVADDGEVYFAGERWSPHGDPLTFEGLPRGELWVVAYGRQRARAVKRVVFSPADEVLRRSATLALRPANALAVRVVDDEGNPVPQAGVTIDDGDLLAHVAPTGEDGAVTFDRLGPAPWGVSVEAEGYDPVARSGVYPSAEPLEIRLERLGGLEVTVVDVDGTPVPSAEVLLSGPGIWPARSSTTDDFGQVSITGLYAGLYDLRARLDDRISATDMSIPLSRGKVVERTLTLVDGRFILVTVTDGPRRADGLEPLPIEGAAVVVVEEGLSSFPIEARTTKLGNALVGPLGEGNVTVSARAQGFVPRLVGGDAIVDGEVTIPLLRGGAIFGRVRDERGFPVGGATIEVFGTDVDGMPIHESTDRTTLRDDLFEFALAGPVPLIPRGELGVMPGPVPPIPHASGLLSPSGGAPDVGDPWVTRDDGVYRAAPITPGRVQVLVQHPEFVESISDVVTLAPGAEVELDVVLTKGGRLEGRVLEEDRLAVVGARLEISALEGTFSQVTYTTDDGSFAMGSVPTAILVSVYREDGGGDVAARLELDLEPGKRKRIEIILPKQREPTTIRFVDERKLPLSRVEAKVVSLDLGTALYRTHFSNDDGMIAVAGARGLPLRILAERPGKAPLVATILEAGEEHELQMTPGMSLRGYVTGKEGRVKLEGAHVTLYTEAGAEHVQTDEDGGFLVEDLAAGRIRLVTRAEGYAEDERVLAFVGDLRRATEIDRIDLVPAGSVEGVVVDDAGDPIAGARVGRDAVPTYLPVGKLPHGLSQTDADGRFTLGGLPAGLVELEAYSPELGRGRVTDVEVRADRVTRRVTITIAAQAYDPRKIRAQGSVALTLAERSGGVLALDVPEGGEAELAGIEPGDRLIAVSGVAVATLEEARDKLSGPLAEDVIVELEREGLGGAPMKLLLRVRRESVRR
ncbi:MAG: carboxypeptidase regulatory-like domain-containing protein [Polyangiaceae bacterium]|nr:carboxypeptidase regulatory-like domain-containing protein [Polyangiaceae bacterium]MBK8938345.1 carboxypeptidase regulatory-like domain-containing protein [Polyangiaceae bacterium]